MTNAWMVAAVAPAAAGLVRELLSVVRHLLRLARIERVATRITQSGSRLVDQDEHGARFELTIASQQLHVPSVDTDPERDRPE